MFRSQFHMRMSLIIKYNIQKVLFETYERPLLKNCLNNSKKGPIES